MANQDMPKDKEVVDYSKDDAEFKKIVTQRYMYNAERCGTKPLVGHLLNILPMPPIKNRAWSAFLIRTTRPVNVVDRTNEVIEVPVGSEVLIPATYTLFQFLSKAAQNAEKVYEVRIEPDVKIDIGGGQSMWTYNLDAKPRALPRGGFGLAAVLGSTPLLPAQAGDAKESDIPF